MENKIIGIIPARYKSSRLFAKPLIKILGKTLLQRTFSNVSNYKRFNKKIYIATDNEKIYNHAKEIGAFPIMTSIKCENGTQRILEAIENVKTLQRAKYIVNIQVDHPFIEEESIENCIKILEKDKKALIATSAILIEKKRDIFSENIVKVVFDKFQNALYFSRSPIPFSKDIKKTDFYHHIGIYVYKKEFFSYLKNLKKTSLQKAEDLEQLKFLEHGFKIKVAISKTEKPFSIDTIEDVKKVEKYLLCQ